MLRKTRQHSLTFASAMYFYRPWYLIFITFGESGCTVHDLASLVHLQSSPCNSTGASTGLLIYLAFITSISTRPTQEQHAHRYEGVVSKLAGMTPVKVCTGSNTIPSSMLAGYLCCRSLDRKLSNLLIPCLARCDPETVTCYMTFQLTMMPPCWTPTPIETVFSMCR